MVVPAVDVRPSGGRDRHLRAGGVVAERGGLDPQVAGLVEAGARNARVRPVGAVVHRGRAGVDPCGCVGALDGERDRAVVPGCAIRSPNRHHLRHHWRGAVVLELERPRGVVAGHVAARAVRSDVRVVRACVGQLRAGVDTRGGIGAVEVDVDRIAVPAVGIRRAGRRAVNVLRCGRVVAEHERARTRVPGLVAARSADRRAAVVGARVPLRASSTTSLPDVASVASNVTVSEARYQPFLSGDRDGVALTCGFVASYLSAERLRGAVPRLVAARPAHRRVAAVRPRVVLGRRAHVLAGRRVGGVESDGERVVVPAVGVRDPRPAQPSPPGWSRRT